MTLGQFVMRNALRRKGRAIFTLGSIAVAFVIFGLLLPIQRVFESRVEFANTNRLIVTNKASIMRPLPVNYGERLAQAQNVELVSHFTFFGAFYRDPSNPVAAVVTEPQKFPAMVEEVIFKRTEELERWFAEPNAVAVGRRLAERYGWSVGDLIPIYSTIYPRKDGSQAWTFRIATIFDATSKDGDTNSMVIDYRYFDQARAFGSGTVGWYAVRVRDAANAGATAQMLDRLFANSPDEISTVTEKAFAQSFLRQVGNFALLVSAALGLVFWTSMLVTANTMGQSVRERFSEIAVLKAFGFSEWRVFGLVIGESLMLMFAGGLVGLLLANIAVPLIASQTNQLLSTITVSWRDWVWGLALMGGLGLLVALPSAFNASRQSIVAGLGEAA